MTDKTTIIGTIAQMGDDENGHPRIVIHSERGDLVKIPPSMMFCAVKITIEKMEKVDE